MWKLNSKLDSDQLMSTDVFGLDWYPVWLGFGSNIGDSIRCFYWVLEQLSLDSRIRFVRSSPLYETLPVGPQDQPDFINACLAFETIYSPYEVLNLCADLEVLKGRQRDIKWGPRTLDLDVLVYGDLSLDSDDLIIPHPEISKRMFVLAPLKDLDPDLIIPGKGLVRDLHASGDETLVRSLDVMVRHH